MKLIQSILLWALCLRSVAAYAAPTASEDVRQHLSDALRGQIKQFLAASFSKKGPPSGTPTAERLDQDAESLLQEALIRYAPRFTVPEEAASSLLAKGPNDADNATAMKRNWEIYKKVVLPLPALMKYLHEQFEAGLIKGGWDLEAARRVSDTHLTEATDAQHRYDESQGKSP